MPLTAAGSQLVHGTPTTMDASKTKHVRVLRPFYFKGARIEQGTIIEVETRFALELIAGGKAEATELQAPKTTGPRRDDAKGA